MNELEDCAATAAEGNDAATRWLIGRLDEIPEGIRAQAVKDLIRQNTMLPDEYRNLMQAFACPEDRFDFASSTFAVWGNVNEVHAVMSVLPCEDQVEVILRAATDYRRVFESVDVEHAERIAGYFDERISEYALTEDEAARVREALGR